MTGEVDPIIMIDAYLKSIMLVGIAMEDIEQELVGTKIVASVLSSFGTIARTFANAAADEMSRLPATNPETCPADPA